MRRWEEVGKNKGIIVLQESQQVVCFLEGVYGLFQKCFNLDAQKQ